MVTASSNRIFSGEQFTGWQRWNPGALAMDASQQRQQRPTETPEAIKRRAHAAGFEEGRQAGYAAGLAEGRAHAAVEAQKIHAIAQSAAAGLQALGDTLATGTVELAIAIAQKVLLREIETQPDAITAVVREALTLLPEGAERVRIIVNNADAEQVRAFVSELAPAQEIAVIGAADVARGGCRIQSACGDVDATLQTRFKQVLDALGASQDAASGN